MPYAPQIVTQNIAPQLMMQGAQAQAQAYAGLGNSLAKGITGYFAEEEKRAKEAAAAAALLNNPFVKERIAKDQPFWELGQKIEEGKAKRNDVSAFLAAATIAKQEGEDALKQQQIQQQIATQKQQEDTAKAEAAYRQGQVDAAKAAEERRKKDEAAWAAANMPALTEYLNKGLLRSPVENMPVMTAPWSAEQRAQRYVEKGGMPTQETNQFIQNLGNIETKRSAQEAQLAKLQSDLDFKQRGLELKEAAAGAEPVTNNGKTVMAKRRANGQLYDVATGLSIEVQQMDKFGNTVGTGVPNPMVFGTAPTKNAPPQAEEVLPTLTPAQVKQAKPGKFTGIDGMKYEKLPNGQIKQL